jgi:signal transduction histidine kinase/DNA-binding NarL/FixJ family response regulator
VLKAHLELGQLRIQLEKRVKERTLELENSKAALHQEMHERLQTEKQLAEEHTRAQLAEHYRRLQADFMDTLCHEIRNPLNGIYGGVSLLQDRLIKLEQFFKEEGAKLDLLTAEKIFELLHKVKVDLQAIEQCSEQQKIIVNDVLDLSKLENNKVELNLVPGDIKQVINNVIQMFNAVFEQKKLKIQVDFPQASALIFKMDMHRLSQIITNLISNSVKFTKEGTVHIIVSIASLSSSESLLEVQVKDTGIGMTSDEINGLFNKFSQANRRITSEYGGSGLGLVISQKLVNLMEGVLRVESQKWQGTNFIFTAKAFVLTVEELKQWQSTQQQHHSSQTTSFDLQGKSILIVEDNLINQRILRNYLEQKGCFCQIAENGQQALDKAAQFKFDLIFMDIEMPVMGGIEATQKLREQKENSLNYRVPIVGLSGNARKEQIEQAKQAGMNDYLTKPYKKEAVYTIIQDYTDKANTLKLVEAKNEEVNMLNMSEHFKQNAAQLLKQDYPFNVSYKICQIIFQLPIVAPLFTEYLCQLILNDLKIHLEKIAQFFEINDILLTNNQLVVVSSSIEKTELLKQFLNEVKLIKEFKSTSPLLRPTNIFNISPNEPERLFSLKRAKISNTLDTARLTSLSEKSLQELIEKLNILLIQYEPLSKNDNDYIHIIQADLQNIQTKDQPLICIKNHIYHIENAIQKQNEIRKINQP